MVLDIFGMVSIDVMGGRTKDLVVKHCACGENKKVMSSLAARIPSNRRRSNL